MLQATYLDDHIEGKGLAASWVMKPALNQAVVDVEKHPINSRFGSTWKELNSKNRLQTWKEFNFQPGQDAPRTYIYIYTRIRHTFASIACLLIT